MAKYNGYANRDTWLVCLWLTNDALNYQKAKKNKKLLLKMKKSALIRALKSFQYKDKINWNNVRVTEVKACIREI